LRHATGGGRAPGEALRAGWAVEGGADDLEKLVSVEGFRKEIYAVDPVGVVHEEVAAVAGTSAGGQASLTALHGATPDRHEGPFFVKSNSKGTLV
jgi:hypothetical protein